MAARHGAMVAGDAAMVSRTGVTMARFAIVIDEDDRAQAHMDAAMEQLPGRDAGWMARAWATCSKQIDQLAKDVVDVVQTAMVERDRMRALLDVLAEVDSATDADTLMDTTARVGARLLEADQLLLARRGDKGELEAIGKFSLLGDGAHEADWRSAIEASLRLPDTMTRFESPATRADERPRGPVLVAAMRAACCA